MYGKSEQVTMNSRGCGLTPATVDGADAREVIRLFVEGLLWIAIAFRVFGNQLGVLNVTGMSGGIILIAATLCFTLMLMRGDQIPVSIWFALGINVFANLTDLVHVGLFTRNLVYWLCLLLMSSYVFRDAGAALRLSFFMAACVFASLALGGTFYDVSKGYGRLGLEAGVVGTMFGNPNDLAQVACLTLAVMLFLSLRRHMLVHLLAIVTATALGAVVLLTLSRQGLVMLGVVLLFYVAALTAGRGRTFGLLLVALIVVSVATLLGSGALGEIRDGYLFRWTLESDRVDYWFTSLNDLGETLLAGRGTMGGYNADGFLPHSTLLWLHLAYGGPCAWLYALWIVWLSVRVVRLLMDGAAAFAEKSAALAVLTVFIAAQFTTVFAAGNFGFILGVALIERLISGYSLSQGSADAKNKSHSFAELTTRGANRCPAP